MQPRRIEKNSISIEKLYFLRIVVFVHYLNHSNDGRHPSAKQGTDLVLGFSILGFFFNHLRSFSFCVGRWRRCRSLILVSQRKNDNHDFRPTQLREVHQFNLLLAVRSICSIQLSAIGGPLGARNFRSRSLAHAHLMLNGHLRNFGCSIAVFLFGFNCFLMIRCGIHLPYGLYAQFVHNQTNGWCHRSPSKWNFWCRPHEVAIFFGIDWTFHFTKPLIINYFTRNRLDYIRRVFDTSIPIVLPIERSTLKTNSSINLRRGFR